MLDSRGGAEPETFPQRTEDLGGEGQPRRAGWNAEFILSGLALILPPLAFSAAAFVFYPPAARAMAPLAIGLGLVGLGLLLIGAVARRRL